LDTPAGGSCLPADGKVNAGNDSQADQDQQKYADPLQLFAPRGLFIRL
jgi:hypothetical protein